jgi:hypothetical protein
MLPDARLVSYRKRRSGCDDPAAKEVRLGRLSLWFSYETLVAFQVDGFPRVVRENVWGPTTGKHLNAIDGGDHSGRVCAEEFTRLYNATVGRLFARESEVTHVARSDREHPAGDG